MLYDYVCPICGKIKEVNHGINEKPEVKCECNEVMRILISSNKCGVIFKADGFTKKVV